ncbi:MAG: D-hexose-6-phosphate mutarotase [Gemmatimonadaceae bacterium]|nr:D-hexose-6-phosphate mutarotase [Gemmatimonadaceae bacterium]
MIPTEFPSLHLRSPDGAHATIALDGGHVTSWVPATEHENRLFVSARSTYGPGKAIRGGIPVIFPQFGAFGSLRQHGFARLCRWTVDGSRTFAGAGRGQLHLSDSDDTRTQWPHAFSADLSIVVEGVALAVAMTIRNTDTSPIAFTAAFHPYFAVRDAFTTRVEGLSGCRYRDSLLEGQMVVEAAPVLQITGPLDRIYSNAPDRLVIRDGARSIIIEKSGFPEAVVWNPGIEGTRSRADFAEGEEQGMLCVEAAAIQHPIVLAPDESWTGTQRMTTA